MRIMMTKLKLTVNENQDAGREVAGRKVRLSGLHVWSLLLAEDGRAYLGTTPARQDSHLSGDQQRNWTQTKSY